MSNIKIPIQVYLEDGDEEATVDAPGRFEVCGRCNGHGTHVNPNIDGHGITMEEWWGPDWDDESREMYMSGGYDVACHECGGTRVVPIIDWQAFERQNPEAAKAYEDQQEQLADLEAMEAAERRYGC